MQLLSINLCHLVLLRVVCVFCEQELQQSNSGLQPHFGLQAAQSALQDAASAIGLGPSRGVQLPGSFTVPSVPESLTSLSQRIGDHFFGAFRGGGTGICH